MHNLPDHRFFNYAEALELFEKFTSVVKKDINLSSRFDLDGYNLWQAYSHAIFLDIRNWTKTRSLDEIKNKHSFLLFLKVSITLCFLFIESVLSWFLFILLQPHFALFSIDKISGPFKNDFRLDALYNALKKEDVSYFEIIHTIPSKVTLVHFLKRMRPVIYLESFDWLTFFHVKRKRSRLIKISRNLILPEFSEAEQALFRALIVKYGSSVATSRIRATIFSLIFSTIRPKKLFSIDDVRHYNEVLLAANYNAIFSCVLQHGHFTDYHVGWKKVVTEGNIIRPNVILVWSEYWKKELLRIGTYFFEEDIWVGGNPSEVIPESPIVDDVITVLVPYEIDAPKSEVRQIIDMLGREKDIRVIFKVRGDIATSKQLLQYGFITVPSFITTVSSVAAVLDSVDCVVGTYSTLLYDMVRAERPILIPKLTFDFGKNMVQGGLAQFFTKDNLIERVRDAANMSQVELSRRKRLLEGKDSKDLKRSIASILILNK